MLQGEEGPKEGTIIFKQNLEEMEIQYLLLLESKTVSHLQLIQARKYSQCKKEPQGKDQIKGLAIRPFAKTLPRGGAS